MKYTYNKLVRDKIPENINSIKGKKCNYRILKNEEYLKALDKKIFEEANEFIEEHSIEELADLMEVIFAIMKVRNISIEEVEDARQLKNSQKGSFKDKIFLIDVEQEIIDEREEFEMKKEWRRK